MYVIKKMWIVGLIVVYFGVFEGVKVERFYGSSGRLKGIW